MQGKLRPVGVQARSRQLRRSIGRLESLEPRHVLDSTVVFSEIMYNPSGADESLEWVELHNQMAVDIDLTGWRLDNGIQFEFPANTILPGGGYLAVAANPAALQAATGFADALGPFDGNLGNGGDTLDLRNHTDRLINSVTYDDDGAWPVGADGSGASLAKRSAQQASHVPDNWTLSGQINGTPGRANFAERDTVEQTTLLPIGATWRYNQSGTDLGTAWRAINYVDASWSAGPALLYVETAALPAAKLTPLTLGRTTYYFRTSFEFTGDAANASIRFNHVIDDGAIFYLNGEEVTRFNMPSGPVTAGTFANVGVGDAVFSTSESISAGLLRPGTNTLAVEVHQSAANSSDVVFGTEVLLERTVGNAGVASPVFEFSEIAPAGANPFWLEVKNTSDIPQSLMGYQIHQVGSLDTTYSFGEQVVPAGGYFTVNAATLGFDPALADRLFLLTPNAERVIDGVVVNVSPQARSSALAGRWQTPSPVTPGAANQFVVENDIVINELMYHARPSYATDAVIQPTTILPVNASWRFDDTAVDRGTEWRTTTYDDSTWQAGPGLFYNETAALPGPKNTLLTLGRPTYYFRTTFNVSGDPAQTSLAFHHIVDDGAVFYINGVEFGRFNMPAGNVTYNTLATPAVGDATSIGPLTIPSHLLVAGTNTLAVELHQNATFSPDVVFGAEINSLAVLTPAVDFVESAEEWLELYNRGASAVDLSGWSLADGIDFVFPVGASLAPGGYAVIARDRQAFAAQHPGIPLLGQYDGMLSDKEERITLLDSRGNVADEVHYFDGGSWPRFADGGGGSLELQSPHADNSTAEAWVSSNETARTEWQHVSYTTTIAPIVLDPPINFHEFVMGLLSAGEIWLDNVSVIENPSGDRRQLMQNGTFDADTAGGAASKWRIQGTHERSRVINDPDQPGNKILQLIADARINYLSNHAETTLANGVQVVNGRTYEISFDARWIAGSPQLHTELYYKDAARTTVLRQPSHAGTPGNVNSAWVANLGPTYAGLGHAPVVPRSTEPVTVSISPHDSDGLESMTLFYAVDGIPPFQSVPMTFHTNGTYEATIPPQANGRVVQFYVQGRDLLGATTMYPPAGPASRALYKVNNAFTQDALRHDFQILMIPADVTALHTPTNMMNNDRTASTVVYDGGEVYYNVGVRMRGSMFTRQTAASTGYNVRFNAEQPFRGVHDTVAFDQNGETEIIAKFLTTQSGHLGGTYDDIINLASPSGAGGGPSLAYLARHDDVFLDEQFEDGTDGTLFKFEGIRVMTSTVDGTPEGLKIYQPIGWVANFDIQDLGSSKELYRWPFLINRRRDKDDYSRMIDAAKAFSLTGDALHNAVTEVMDVDNLTQTFALMSLLGIGDVYSQGNPHNLNFYVRPSDSKLLIFPWDWDFTFNLAANAPLHGNQNISKILDLPHFDHFLLGQMDHLMNTVFNRAYMTRWTAHYGTLLGANFNGLLSNIDARSTFVRSQLPPTISFDVVTPSGATNAPSTTLVGRGWVNVKEIKVAGATNPLAVKWTSSTAWEATVPLQPGVNALALQAYDFAGNLLGTDQVTITSNLPRPVLDYLRISEIMYHPAAPTAAELAAGFVEDDFEFLEVTNTSHGINAVVVDLSGVSVNDAIGFTLGNLSLAPGEFGVIVENSAAFRARYGTTPRILGEFASGRLSNGGETITLIDAAGSPIMAVEYSDNELWSEAADGVGASLELRDVSGIAAEAFGKYYSWRASAAAGGSPGSAGVARPGIVINEVLANTNETTIGADSRFAGDAIELYNATTAPIQIGGWWLSDASDHLQKYRIPEGTMIAPGGYWVVDESQLNPTPLTPAPHHFSLSGVGDDVWLTVAPSGGTPELYIDEVHFSGSFDGQSLGRIDSRYPRMLPQSRESLGCTNRSTEMGAVIISEIQYAAGTPSVAALAIAPTLVADDLEFIEVYNTTTAAIDLTNWSIGGGVSFDFADGMMLPSGETAIIVSFNPLDPLNGSRLNAFRAHYAIPTTVALAGGYSGKLSDQGDQVQLRQPDAPPMNDPTSMPQVVVDEIVYDNLVPWPVGASGSSVALHRIGVTLGSSLSTSWNGSVATPGTVAFRTEIPGDLNGDARVNSLDIDQLFDAVSRGRNNAVFDLNRDARIDQADLRSLIESTIGTQFGDANLDGQVNAIDLAIWSAHQFADCTGWSRGDFNGDARTDGSDFNLWNMAKFSSAPRPAADGEPMKRAPRAAGGVTVDRPAANMALGNRPYRANTGIHGNIVRRAHQAENVTAPAAIDQLFAQW